MNNETLLKVAVPVPLSRLFDYLPPHDSPLPAPGSRVSVPFGRRHLTGLVMGAGSDSTFDRKRLKRAKRLDAEPLLAENDLWLVRFASSYYQHPIGEVAAAALPVLLRQGRDLYPATERFVATSAANDIEVEALGRRAPKQAELLVHIVDAGAGGIDADLLNETFPAWRRAGNALGEKGLIEVRLVRAEENEPPVELTAMPGPVVNEDQSAAIRAISASNGFAAFMLDGVTGSGKTEVYLSLIREVLASSRQALVLVPEIGLTPQLVERFRSRLGVEPAVLHSGLTDAERLSAWREARSGNAGLVLGTRSAVFTPLPNAGIIIVDEEHDHSFKQQDGLRYSARDLAIARAKQTGVPVILGSATPTLEILKHCRDGSFKRLALPERAGGAQPPDIRLVDLVRDPAEEGLSTQLYRAIDRHLAAKGQALIFLNRRGFAPTLICGDCGHVAECRRCDARMTVHARQRMLRCHHCGAARPLVDQCDDCGAPVRPLGEGTERLEDVLRRRFPDKNISRIDSDSTRARGSIAEALEEATSGDADILVGTQMLSKGHHFPRLTLVGVVNADQGLFSTDFRSDERLAQSIVQVAGRAGREQVRGEVLIQTAFAAHPFWQRLIEGGYAGVAEDALEERKNTHWPPFSRLALLRASAHSRADTHAFLHAARLRAESFNDARVRILGPVDAVMARKAGRYRAQLLFQSNARPALQAVLNSLRLALEDEPLGRKVRWSIDVDPIELF